MKLINVFPNSPIIAFKGNPSLRKKSKTVTNRDTSQITYHENQTQIATPTISILSQHIPRQPIYTRLQKTNKEKCCFTESTSLRYRYPINLTNLKQSFYCKTKEVLYLAIIMLATLLDHSRTEHLNIIT